MSDAVQLLEEQHAEATALFMKLERLTDPVTCGQIFRSLDAKLRDHAAIEEQVFYPAFRERVPKQANEVTEALHEHGEMESLLAELERSTPGSGAFKDALGRLQTVVQHHVREEERQIFPQTRRHFSQSEIDDLGFRMIKAASLHNAVLAMAPR